MRVRIRVRVRMKKSRLIHAPYRYEVGSGLAAAPPRARVRICTT